MQEIFLTIGIDILEMLGDIWCHDISYLSYNILFVCLVCQGSKVCAIAMSIVAELDETHKKDWFYTIYMAVNASIALSPRASYVSTIGTTTGILVWI